jgi:peroxiredoxin
MTAALIFAPTTGEGPVAASKATSLASDPEPAPIVERKLDYGDFTLKTYDGHPFNLHDYAKGKSLIIVSYIAGWCENSNRNAHVVKRLYDKYRERGLGVVAVSEYSTPEELSVYVNRIGVDYPVVVETDHLKARKESSHYRYRTQVGDARKWGTPFHVIISARDIERERGGLLARHVHTVSGEIIEAEAETFIEQRLAGKAD